VYNGEGRLTEVSGASYEGLWINGRPAYMAVKLVITGLDSGSMRVAPGESFTISVECHTDLGELMQGISQPFIRYRPASPKVRYSEGPLFRRSDVYGGITVFVSWIV